MAWKTPEDLSSLLGTSMPWHDAAGLLMFPRLQAFAVLKWSHISWSRHCAKAFLVLLWIEENIDFSWGDHLSEHRCPRVLENTSFPRRVASFNLTLETTSMVSDRFMQLLQEL